MHSKCSSFTCSNFGGNATSNNDIALSSATFLQFKSIITLDTQFADASIEDLWHDANIEVDFTSKFGYSINYNENFLQFGDDEVP